MIIILPQSYYSACYPDQNWLYTWILLLGYNGGLLFGQCGAADSSRDFNG